MSLPLPLQGVVNLFGQSITAYDATFTRTLGRVNKTIEPDRTIFGCIQPKRALKVDLSSSGALATGSLLLHTRDEVTAADMSQIDGPINRQTYINYENQTWKVETTENWADKNGGSNRYELIKYTNIDE